MTEQEVLAEATRRELARVTGMLSADSAVYEAARGTEARLVKQLAECRIGIKLYANRIAEDEAQIDVLSSYLKRIGESTEMETYKL